MKNPYEVLGLTKDASEADIKKAYRSLAQTHHPDHGGNEETFKEVSAAYETLNDPEKKQLFDTYGTDNPKNIHQDNMGPIFDFMRQAGGFGFSWGGEQQSNLNGDDIQQHLHITFMEAALGTSKNLNIEYPLKCSDCKGNGSLNGTNFKQCEKCGGHGKIGKQQGFMHILQTCSKCHGKGNIITAKCPSCNAGFKAKQEVLKVTIPAGIDNGNTMRLTGKGMPSEHGADNGDLYLRISVAEHEKFERRGAVILSEEKVNYLDAILGTKINVETIHGTIKLTIPEGTQPGDVLKMSGKGIITKAESGDHLVLVKVDLPRELKDDERAILEQLRSGK
jgi:molecular chaperone DnaJ